MTKYMIAVLAVSLSVLAAACGGGTEEAKSPEGQPAGDTTAPAGDATKTPEAAPADGTTPAAPAEGDAKPPQK
jgi:hypothetical protein